MKNFFAANLSTLRKRKALTQIEAATALGFGRSTFANYETGHTEPDIDTILGIASFFDVSADELLGSDLRNVHLIEKAGVEKKGENVHLNVHPNVHLKPKNEPVLITFAAEESADYKVKTVPVPITDISVAAGSGAYNSDYISNVEAIRLPQQLLKRNATYLCVKIKGASMAPTLHDGGFVIIRLLDKGEWAKMHDERVFVVTDREGKAYLKRVKNRFKQDFIVLRSDSPDQANFPSFNLATEDINSIWEVEWYFTAKMPNIHDAYYSRLQRLEERVDDLVRINPKLK